MRVVSLCAVTAMAVATGCSGETSSGSDPTECRSDTPTRTISCVASFEPGVGAGAGQDDFPANIYGEPHGAGDKKGNAVDVLSLGHGGEITVGFGGNAIVDGPGPDFLVFENVFYAFGKADKPFVEVAEISVSKDGEDWTAFPCASEEAPYEGCAGRNPVFANPDEHVSSFDPKVAGGDAFDLAAVGVEKATFVRIRDRGTIEGPPNAGFDLDAIAIVNAETR